MSLFTRFFGKQDADELPPVPLLANPDIKNPRSLQVLFGDRLRFDPNQFSELCRSFHPSMAKARSEFDAGLNIEGNVFGLAGWENHIVKLVGFDVPMPAEAVEMCVAPAHYDGELKARDRSHKAHVLLYYAGYEMAPVEQYVALAAIAGVLAQMGAIAVLNESAHTALPASVLSVVEVEGDILDLLRALSLPMLYCGFVKFHNEDGSGVWMRTYGAEELGLPDLAACTKGDHEATRYFTIFDNVLNYLLDSGARLSSGHTMQIDEDEYIRFNESGPHDPFDEGDGKLLITEVITRDEINR